MMLTDDACPAADVLGRYIDGTLAGEHVGAVTHHVTHCASCRSAIENVVEIEERPKVRPYVSHPVWWLAAAAVVLALGVPLLRHRRDARAEEAIAQLVAASPKSGRIIEARLTGGFPWAPFHGPRRSPPIKSEEELLASGAAGEVLEQLGADRSPRSLQAAGVAHLMSGDAAEAVTLLSEAARKAPDDARIWSDLSAALYTAAEGDQRMLRQALTAATRACTSDPSIEEACFNRGVILEHAGTPLEVAGAWRDFLARFPNGSWAEEARERLSRGGSR